MHPFENTAQLFAVVGAPYIPERHREDGRDETDRHFAAWDAERSCQQSTAPWPRSQH